MVSKEEFNLAKTILAYGFDLPEVDGFVPLPIFSDRSMLDGDIIIVEPTIAEFHTSGSYVGHPTISESGSASYRQFTQRWKNQLSAAFASGKLVIFFLREKETRHYYTGESKQVGTPGRPRSQSIVMECSNFDLIPVALNNLSIARGEIMLLTKEASLLTDYWKEFGSHSAYTCFYDLPKDWQAMVITKSGSHVVGALSSNLGGTALLLPEVEWGFLEDEAGDEPAAEDGDDGWSERDKQFTLQLRDAIFNLDKLVRRGVSSTEMPQWAEARQYRLAKETVIEEQMVVLGTQMEGIRAQQDGLTLELRASATLRNLLFETGNLLEAAVREALEAFSFKVEHLEKDGSEFDIIFESAEGRFIGEVEGKDHKPISVEKISQLHRNLSEDFAREEVDELATGVLFGNAFRLKPPEERGDFFTEKVVTFAKTVRVALVQTTDLFAAARHARDSGDQEYASACRAAILAGTGAVVQFPNVPVTDVEQTTVR